jgi:hypothetical protein
MTPTDVRMQLHEHGYAPLPLAGKKCFMADWPTGQAGPQDIKLWLLRWPGWTNTGAVCAFMPTLDLDIFDQEAACIAEDIVRRRYEARGRVLVRIGKSPKRAIPFRTNEPFKKIQADLIRAKLEFLAEGQQVAVAGIHPEGMPYRWQGEALWQVPWDELPYIREDAARALVDEIGETLCREFGYQRKAERSTEPHTFQNTHHVSPVSIAQGDRFVPDRLHRKIVELMRGARLLHQRRVRGVLRPLVEARESRNYQLYWAALQFRELIGSGVIDRDGAEQLLLLCAMMNGYVAKRGEDHAWSSIKSGLNAKRFGPDTGETFVCLDGGPEIHAPSREELPLTLVFWKNPARWSANDKQTAVRRLKQLFEKRKRKPARRARNAKNGR